MRRDEVMTRGDQVTNPQSHKFKSDMTPSCEDHELIKHMIQD
jgi:hypothetical protein